MLNGKAIKSFTGGDKRQSRGNFKDFFEWTPRAIPIISINRTPKIKDESEGLRRRLIFVPLEVNLRALPKDRQREQGEVERELAAEGSGILNWMLEGFRDFMAEGINPPPVMLDLKDKLLEASDPVGTFLSDMTVREASGEISVNEFFKVHERWCEDEGRTAFTAKTVREIMIEKGMTAYKTLGKSHWQGIAWAPDAADLVEAVTGFRPASEPAETDSGAPF